MNWKNSLLPLALAAAFALSAEVNVLERFDSDDNIAGKLSGGAKIDPAAGLEKGALTAVGCGKSMQYIYEYRVQGKPGDQFAVAMDFRTTPNFPNQTLMFVIVYNAPRGVKIPSTYFKLPPSPQRWLNRRFTFTLPEQATGARVMLRIAGAKAPAAVFVDFLRIVSVTEGQAPGIDLESFETDFTKHQSETQPLFDHFLPGPGGKIITDDSGSFFQANGDGTKMQYALYIDNIKVQPGGKYLFEAKYQTTPAFKGPANGILIFFYKDKDGNKAGQSRFYFREAKEWKNLVHNFTAPDKCAYVDIGLNIRGQSEKEWIRLNQIRFRPDGGTAK